jgi:hypothetical protein
MQHVEWLESGADIDPIEEMRLRTWARQHYAPRQDRDASWHPIVLDEMRRKDGEQH